MMYPSLHLEEESTSSASRSRSRHFPRLLLIKSLGCLVLLYDAKNENVVEKWTLFISLDFCCFLLLVNDDEHKNENVVEKTC
ncbi:unnamed protein product [Trifolium pratense]|uniref:Uncharacterized protein n=1 Tax=Trifolium pratense TaxID=57577 RepID=A0ACB0KG08_TRIPR|nr:unnamed protein product [Trifolium pratense]